MFFLVYFVLLACSTLAQGENIITQKKSLFVLAGQSNMAGRGGVKHYAHWDGKIPPQCQPNSLIHRLNVSLKWEEAHEPLHRDIDNATCGVGPGMPFAHSILERNLSIGVIGLVPCAVGGTNITQWKRGGRLYKQLISRAWAARQGGGLIRALLWYQGESDSINHANAVSYKMRLERFFSDVRSDLQLPELPVIHVALASGGKYKNTIRKAQLEIGLPNIKTCDAEGLEIEPTDQYRLHITTAAQVSLGQMMADVYIDNFYNNV